MNDEEYETVPQSGRARDIYIAEIVIIYIADLGKIARKREEYSNLTLDTLRTRLGFPRYKHVALRQLSYNEVIEISRDDIINALAEGDVPTKAQQEELIRQAGLDPKLIEKLYYQATLE